MAILLCSDPIAGDLFAAAVGTTTRTAPNVADLRDALDGSPDEDTVVIGPDIDINLALDVAARERVARPTVGVVLLRYRVDTGLLGQALRAGVREVVPSDELQGLAEACRRSAALTKQMRQSLHGGVLPTTRNGHIVTVFSAKGGCGKTTIATNLGAALAMRGHRTCIVDIDLSFGDVGVAMQLFPSKTLADAMSYGATLDEASLSTLVVHHSDNLDVLLAPLEPGAVDRIPSSLITGLLTLLRGMYEYVVVDTPPAFTDHVLAAFDMTDYYLLLATLDVPALKNLRLSLETLDMLGYPRERWRVVLNRADAKVGLAIDDVKASLRTDIATEIPSSRAVPASINRGIPIVQENPSHAVSTAIRRLATDLIERTQDPAKAPTRHRRSLALLRRGGATA